MGKVNEAIDEMGFFSISTGMRPLKDLENVSALILYIGMAANLLVIMLIIIAILLIYSLLLISIEKKSFEFGVMRLAGLSKSGLILLITI